MRRADGAGDGAATPAPAFTELSARRLGPVRRFFVRRPVAMDVLLLACFAGWSLLLGVGADSMYVLHAWVGGERVAQMQLAALALTTAGATALFWRRRRPVPVAAAMAVLGVVALATTGTTAGFDVGLALALYAVATTQRPLVTWSLSGAAVLVLLVAARLLPLPQTIGAVMLGVDPRDVADLESVVRSSSATGFVQSSVWNRAAVPVLVLALLAVAVGTAVRNRRLHLASFVEAANALARDQEQRARLAQAAERARIAREMHDVVAHSISVMVALGGGAAAAVDWAPERSKAALDELVATGRSALGDMRRVLGVLHDEDAERPGDGGAAASAAAGGAGASAGAAGAARGASGTGDVRPALGVGGAEDAPLEPQPGSLDLAALVERFRTAGVPVRTTGLADEDLRTLDASLQLAVYRIVQESLTNALRHAPGTPWVEVGVHRGPDHVEVVVADQGPTRPVAASEGSGRGLVGVRERAAVFGGTAEAGPHGRGWRVRALLPWHEGDA